MLKLENISKSFLISGKRKRVLDDINLEVRKGERIAITGKSGEGKTTLLNIIAGIIKPDRGKIFFNEKRIIYLFDIHTAKLRNKHFGFIFQTFRLLPDETVIENLLLPAKISGFVSKKVKERALDLLRDFGLFEFRNLKTGLLSGGQKQRLSIARALINDPSLILADEPTANLDRETSDEIAKILQKIVTDGKAMLIVTHQEELINSCDRKYILKNGKLEQFNGKNSVNI